MLPFVWEQKAIEVTAYLQKIVQQENGRPPVLWAALLICLLGHLNLSVNSFIAGDELGKVCSYLLCCSFYFFLSFLFPDAPLVYLSLMLLCLSPQLALRHLSIVKQRANSTSYFSVPAHLLVGLAAAGRHSIDGGAVDLWGAVTDAVLSIPSLKNAMFSRSLHSFRGVTLDRSLLDLCIPSVFEGLPFTLHSQALAKLMVVPVTLALARLKFPSVAAVTVKKERRHSKSPIVCADITSLCLVEAEPPAGQTPLNGDVRYLLGGAGDLEFEVGLYKYKSWRYISSAATRHSNILKWSNNANGVILSEWCAALAKRVVFENKKRTRTTSSSVDCLDEMEIDDENCNGAGAAQVKVSSATPTPGPELDVLVPYYSFLVESTSRMGHPDPPAAATALLTAVLGEVVATVSGDASLVFTSPLWKTARACQVARLFDTEAHQQDRIKLLETYDGSYTAYKEAELSNMARVPM